MYSYEEVESIASYLRNHSSVPSKIGIVCGTGLGGLADVVENKVTLHYKDIPKFPVSTGK